MTRPESFRTPKVRCAPWANIGTERTRIPAQRGTGTQDGAEARRSRDDKCVGGTEPGVQEPDEHSLANTEAPRCVDGNDTDDPRRCKRTEVERQLSYGHRKEPARGEPEPCAHCDPHECVERD